MTVLFVTHPRYFDHDTGSGHPERPQRLTAVLQGAEQLRSRRRAGVDRTRCRVRRRSGAGAQPGLRRGRGPVLRQRWGLARRRHRGPARVVRGRACSPPGAGLTAVDRLDGGRGRGCLLRRPPAGSPRRADTGHGVLPVQQRGGDRSRPGRSGRAGAHRRLRRPPRQRHPGHVLRRPAGHVRLDAPVPAVPGHGPARRRRHRARRGARRSTSRSPPGTTGDAFLAAVDEVVAPLAESWKPTWLLLSAGFDAHRADPLTGLGLSAGDYADLTLRLLELVRGPAPAGVPRGRLRPRGSRPRRPRAASPPWPATGWCRSRSPPAGRVAASSTSRKLVQDRLDAGAGR